MFITQAVKKKEVEDRDEPKYPSYKEFLELKKIVKSLQAQKEPKKLSALNKFKKEIISPITEQALSETDYVDLIPVDKMRLLNKTYPIIWEKLVLEPLYTKYNCETEEDKEKLKNKKNIQADYTLQVDSIIDEMNEGELDDQEHYREDLASLFTEALIEAAETFQKLDDEDSDYDYDEDDDE